MSAPPLRQRRRSTAKRRAVLDALSACDKFRSARQLYLEICQRQANLVALTTVYRILHALAEEQIAATQRAEDGEVLYRLRNGNKHEHYLLCRRCGDAVAFSPKSLEEHTNQFAAEYHFADIAHYINFYGTCPGCREVGELR